MDINRNQFFMVGVFILLLGAQFRVVDSFVLNEKTTRILAKQTAEKGSATASMEQFTAFTKTPLPRKIIRPPDWSGWCLLSIGSVLVLHSFALPKPG